MTRVGPPTDVDRPPPALAAWLQAMAAFTRGDIDVATLEARVGRSSSGTARLALSRRCVVWQREHALRVLYASLAELEPDRFAAWSANYLGTAQAHDRRPAELGRRFPEYLRGALARGEHVPRVAIELAELAWLVHETQESPVAPDPSVHAVCPTAAVRLVEEGSGEWTKGAWLVWQSECGLRTRRAHLDRPSLLAFGLASGELEPTCVAASERAAVVAAGRKLGQWGVALPIGLARIGALPPASEQATPDEATRSGDGHELARAPRASRRLAS